MSSWIVEPIGELFDIGAGKSVTPSARVGDRQYPFLRTANVFWGRIDVSKVDAMHFSDAEIAHKSLRAGDLLVCEGGDIGRAAIWRGELANCGFQNHLHRLRAKSTLISPLFAMYYLQAGFTQLGIFEGAGNKTTIPNLSRNRLAALEIPVPAIDEQRRIAAILWKVQRAIEVQEQQVATVRELKQAAMRQLFTRGLRGEALKETEIGMVPERWEISSVGAIASVKGGKRLPKGRLLSTEVTPYPYVRVTDMRRGSVELADLRYVPVDIQPSISRYIITSRDVYITIAGTIGVVGMVPECLNGANLTENAARLVVREDAVTPRFLMYALENGVVQEQVRSLTLKNAQPKLALNRIEQLRLAVPRTLAEQHEIATALQTIDRKLAHHEHKRDTLQELFKTLLHGLMTGRIRVHELDIDITALAGGPTGGEDS